MAQEGTVKWFSEGKGYGLISPDDEGEDVFVHYTAIKGSGFRSLEEGERVTYEVDRGAPEAAPRSQRSQGRVARREATVLTAIHLIA